jgi:hypothetical protein
MLCVLSFSEQKCSDFQKFISQRNSEVSASKCVSEWRGKIKKPAAILWTMWTQWTQKSKVVHIVHWVHQVYLKFFTHLTTGVIPSLLNPVFLSWGFPRIPVTNRRKPFFIPIRSLQGDECRLL